MMYSVHRLALPCVVSIALLSGCAGSTAQQDAQAVYTIPTPQPTPYRPPVSESYVIQRAPQRSVETVYAPVVPIEQSPDYEGTSLFEVGTPPPSITTRAAAPRPVAPAARQNVEVRTRIDQRPARYENGFAPFEAARTPVTPRKSSPEDPGISARERAAERVAERATKREEARVARANPKVDRRSIFGRFVTRATNPVEETRPEPASRSVREQNVASVAPRPAPAPVARPQSFAERSVARAPIPGLKPYILARTPSPSFKPRRAVATPEPQTRTFDVVSASTLPNALPASTPPSSVTIPTEPGADLSARFFPTPGKPSTLGTERDQQLDVASIDAARYGIGGGIGGALDNDAATAEWTDAVRLIEAGEVEALAILEDSDLVLTLCSGRDILTTPPDLAAAATLTAPQIICGQNKPLALR